MLPTNVISPRRENTRHPHLDHGYTVTSYSSQGQTAERVLIHIITNLAAKDLLNSRMVEAAGVELFGVLITRKLLILGIATTAKTAPLPDPLYVYCTKMLFALESHGHTLRPQYPIDSP